MVHRVVTVPPTSRGPSIGGGGTRVKQEHIERSDKHFSWQYRGNTLAIRLESPHFGVPEVTRRGISRTVGPSVGEPSDRSSSVHLP